MAQTLEYNNSVTVVVPVEIPAFDDDMSIIQKLEDEPNDVGGLTAAELKEHFDRSGVALQNYINNTLLPAVISEGATEQARQAAEAERVANEIERATSEDDRISAEDWRAEAELHREAAENERVAAENARKNSIVGYVARAERAADAALEYMGAAEAARDEILQISGNILTMNDMDKVARAVLALLPVYAGEVEDA